jgi:hypothetical protein
MDDQPSTAGVGGAIHREPAAPGTQNAPLMDVDEVTDEERLDGILQQLRADLPGANRATVDHALRGRLAGIGLDLPDDEIDAHVDALMATGSA